MRGLNDSFKIELINGLLSSLLNYVKTDDTLSMEIRNNIVMIYYRGGKILHLKYESRKQCYTLKMETKYFKENERTLSIYKKLPKELSNETHIDKWLKAIPELKHAMDNWLFRHPKREREEQQIIEYVNNFKKNGKSTDYYIIDIEYAKGKTRFDMVAAYWPSESGARRRPNNIGLAIIELKTGDGALNSKKSGIIAHVEKTNKILEDKTFINSFKEEMIKVLNQKIELGLVNHKNPIKSFSDENPEFIFILSEHDPDKSNLNDILKNTKMLDMQNAHLKFMASNFFGYGLFRENLFTLNEFKERFKNQIYSKQ